MRATGARALERPRRKRGPGRGAGVGVGVRGEAIREFGVRGFARPLIRRFAPPYSRWEKGTAECGCVI
ncbi:hypothetical protein E1J25_05330 [Xanthomonas hortorum pv. taraxaci]|nr:hypothetical protein [Xanthomonas hortorum pv. taraxaci]